MVTAALLAGAQLEMPVLFGVPDLQELLCFEMGKFKGAQPLAPVREGLCPAWLWA